MPVATGKVTQLRLLPDPEDALRQEAHQVNTNRGASFPSAASSARSVSIACPAGTFRSNTSSVIATANRPSLRAANRSTLCPVITLYPVPIARHPFAALEQTARPADDHRQMSQKERPNA